MSALLLISGCGTTKVFAPRTPIVWNIKTDVNNLLPAGTFTVNIMDGIMADPRMEVLVKKFKENSQKNYEWFVDYVAKSPSGQPLPYHINFGMTENEYKEMQDYMNNINIVSTGTEELTIIKNNDTIRFKAKGKLSVLDTVIISLEKNMVTIGEHQLTFQDKVIVDGNKSALKDSWKGYKWEFSEPKNPDAVDFKNPQQLNLIGYGFTLGRGDENGKTMMFIKMREITNGVQTMHFELPLVF